MPQKFPKVMSTFGVTPYSPDRDDPEKNRQLYEHYQDQVSTQPLPEDTLPWNVPFPPGQFAQAEFDDMLQRRIVDPLAQAGMEDLGAGLAAVPSAAHSMIVPQTEFDLAATVIPLPGIAKALKADKRAFPEISKAMRAEKKARDIGEYSKAVEALRGEDPDLGAIKVSPDINVTPGMAEKNFMQSRKKNVLEKQELDEYNRPEMEDPRSELSTGIREGLPKGYGSWGDNQFNQLLLLNEHIPGLKKLMQERELILEGNPKGTTSYIKEVPGLMRIEKEIADVLRKNKNDLIIPNQYQHRSMKLSDPQTLKNKIWERDKLSRYDLEKRLNQGNINNTIAQFAQGRDWTKIDPKKYYELDGNIMSGQELKDELLQMSTGDLHMAKWKEVEKPKKSILDSYDMEEEDFDDLRDFTSKPKSKKIDEPKPPKGDPEASLRQFPGIRSQLDIAPSRMNERGEAFGDVGQSDFRPYDQPMPASLEPIQKRNYVEAEMDPKEKMWNEYVERNLYLKDKPEQLKKLRSYFDNRWDQAEGTAEGKMMQFDMPVSESWKPRDQKSVTNNYIDELAFKKFAKPYEKTMDAERNLQSKIGFKPVETAVLDDMIQTHFDGDQVQTPGRQLQNRMYKGRPSFEAEQEKFGKIKEQMQGRNGKVTEKFRIIKADGKDVTRAFGSEEDMAGMTQKELQDIIDPTGKRYRVVPDVSPEESEKLLMEKLKDF